MMERSSPPHAPPEPWKEIVAEMQRDVHASAERASSTGTPQERRGYEWAFKVGRVADMLDYKVGVIRSDLGFAADGETLVVVARCSSDEAALAPDRSRDHLHVIAFGSSHRATIAPVPLTAPASTARSAGRASGSRREVSTPGWTRAVTKGLGDAGSRR